MDLFIGRVKVLWYFGRIGCGVRMGWFVGCRVSGRWFVRWVITVGWCVGWGVSVGWWCIVVMRSCVFIFIIEGR